MKLNISKEELETMNYDDIAYIILKEKKKPIKINDLFKDVCDVLEISNEEYIDKIADFFGLLTTDKRFIMLENGLWDLKEYHNPEIVIDSDEEEEEIEEIEPSEANEVEEEETEDENIFYDDDSDDDLPDNELDDFMVIDVDSEETSS